MIEFFEVIGLVATLNAFMVFLCFVFFRKLRIIFYVTTGISLLVIGYLCYGFELEFENWKALTYPSELLTAHSAILFGALLLNIIAMACLLFKK